MDSTSGRDVFSSILLFEELKPKEANKEWRRKDHGRNDPGPFVSEVQVATSPTCSCLYDECRIVRVVINEAPLPAWVRSAVPDGHGGRIQREPASLHQISQCDRCQDNQTCPHYDYELRAGSGRRDSCDSQSHGHP